MTTGMAIANNVFKFVKNCRERGTGITNEFSFSRLAAQYAKFGQSRTEAFDLRDCASQLLHTLNTYNQSYTEKTTPTLKHELKLMALHTFFVNAAIAHECNFSARAEKPTELPFTIDPSGESAFNSLGFRAPASIFTEDLSNLKKALDIIVSLQTENKRDQCSGFKLHYLLTLPAVKEILDFACWDGAKASALVERTAQVAGRSVEDYLQFFPQLQLDRYGK